MATTPNDVGIAIGRTPTDAEFEQWQMWIDEARLLIRTRLGSLDALDQEVLDYVVRQSVVAQVRRPDDATQVDVAVDDGHVSRRYTSATGRVAILEEWWELLVPNLAAGGAFSIDPASSGPSVEYPPIQPVSDWPYGRPYGSEYGWWPA